MKLWWMGWLLPSSVSPSAVAPAWPDGMRVWQSLERLMLGAAWVVSAEVAWQTVLPSYGGARSSVMPKFQPREIPAESVQALAARFPGGLPRRPG